LDRLALPGSRLAAEAGSTASAHGDIVGEMKTVWQARVGQAAAKVGENAPMAATCCNACRTCVQTNLVAAGLAGVLAVGAAVARLWRSPGSA
jgi:hypothetical protein